MIIKIELLAVFRIEKKITEAKDVVLVMYLTIVDLYHIGLALPNVNFASRLNYIMKLYYIPFIIFIININSL